jgi:hypothetical protein
MLSSMVKSVSTAICTQSIRRHAATFDRGVWLASRGILSLLFFVYIPLVHASCRLGQVAEFHLEWVDNAPIINGQVNGHPVRILLETGSSLTFITNKAAHQLNLPVREYRERAILEVGGWKGIETAVVNELRIDGFVLKDYTIGVVPTEIQDANGVAILQLSADFLSHFTTELDFAHGVVRLLLPQDCKLEQLAYWTPSYFRIDVSPFSPDTPFLLLPVKLNGKHMKAHLVSGSAISFVTPQSARDAGVVPGGQNTEPAGDIVGLKAEPIPTWIGRFDTLDVGGETIKNARLRIGEVFPGTKYRPNNSVDMHLGSDFLQANRLIIVPGKDAILFTYNGGAVFQLERPDEAAPGLPDRSLPLDKGSTTLHED